MTLLFLEVIDIYDIYVILYYINNIHIYINI